MKGTVVPASRGKRHDTATPRGGGAFVSERDGGEAARAERCYACENNNYDATGGGHDGPSTHSRCALRVSSKDQEAEGFSLPAQVRLLRERAVSSGFAIAREFEDVETAKMSGRTHVDEMVAYLKKHHATCRTILVEKTDRLYRNLTGLRSTIWMLTSTSSRKM